MSKIEIKGFPVTQNGQDFIIGKTTIQDLLKYTMYTERLIVGFDEDEKPIYNEHIQRKVESSRINRIADFLLYDDSATFPTNIVLGIPASVIESQECDDNGIIHIFLNDFVAENIEKSKNGDKKADVFITIIDGQHRIAGIEKAIDILENQIDRASEAEALALKNKLNNLLNIELVISCFIDKSLEYEAMIFSTINRTQKRVSQDLVHSLFGLTENDTPYKTALEIALALNGHPLSPFYKRIKLYGGSYDKSFVPPLSQSTMIRKIVSFISESFKEAELDRFRNRRDLKIQKGKKFLPFRMYYAINNDKAIADCLYYFFQTIKKIYGKLWEYDAQRKPTNVLQSTIGFEALMDLLKDILQSYDIPNFYSGVFDRYLSSINELDLSDTSFFPMSTKGKKILYNSLFVRVFPDDPSTINKIREIENERKNSD